MPEVRVLSDDDVAAVLDVEALLPVVADALRAQRDGRVERPERPHFPVGRGEAGGDGDGTTDPAGTALTMPASVHGADHYATKLVSVHENNDERDLETVQAQIAVTEARTGRPAAYLAGTRVTNARTGCVGGCCVERLPTPVEVGVIGAGRQARWQVRAVAAATDVQEVRVYSPSGSRHDCVADLRDRGVDARAVETPRAAVENCDAVVTATTATDPVFPGDALAPGTLVVAVGAYTPATRELDARTVERARGRLFADVPDEAVTVGDLAAPGVDVDAVAPVADLFDGEGWPPDPAAGGVDDAGGGSETDDVTVVKSVGSAVMDAAAAEHLLGRARSAGVGTVVEL